MSKLRVKVAEGLAEVAGVKVVGQSCGSKRRDVEVAGVMPVSKSRVKEKRREEQSRAEQGRAGQSRAEKRSEEKIRIQLLA